MLMRRFIIVGHKVPNDGRFTLNDLAGSAGRVDILCRCINSAFFLSHAMRKEVEVQLVLPAGPDPCTIVRFVGAELRYLNPDERSTAALIRNALLKRPGSAEIPSTPGVYARRGTLAVALESVATKSKIFLLHEDGEDFASVYVSSDPASSMSDDSDSTFLLGDNTDLSPDELETLERFKHKLVSLGSISYHSDHCITYLNLELDRRADMVCKKAPS